MSDKKIIGKRLRALRGTRNPSDVCCETGISRSALTMYETGQRVPRDEIKVALARCYGTTVEAIFFTD